MKLLGIFLLLSAWIPLHSFGADKAWIVLIPGAASSGDQVYAPPLPNFFGNRYFGGYQDTLKNDGFDTIVCPKTADQDRRTIEQREDECANQIALLAQRGSRDVVLLGHSTGGLVARELAQDNRVKDRIKSAILLSTPNRGTVFADFVLDEEAKGINPSSILASLADYTSDKKHYLPELRSVRTHDPASSFAGQDAVDNPEVSYFSFSTSFHEVMNVMAPTQLLINAQLKAYGLDGTPYGTDNDGVVPVYSQIYGQYLGNIPISHIDGSCTDQSRLLAPCKASLKAVLPVLESLAANPT